jgi:hypothetical protein
MRIRIAPPLSDKRARALARRSPTVSTMTYTNADVRLRGAACPVPEDRYRLLRDLERRLDATRVRRRRQQEAAKQETGSLAEKSEFLFNRVPAAGKHCKGNFI